MTWWEMLRSTLESALLLNAKLNQNLFKSVFNGMFPEKTGSRIIGSLDQGSSSK